MQLKFVDTLVVLISQRFSLFDFFFRYFQLGEIETNSSRLKATEKNSNGILKPTIYGTSEKCFWQLKNREKKTKDDFFGASGKNQD